MFLGRMWVYQILCSLTTSDSYDASRITLYEITIVYMYRATNRGGNWGIFPWAPLCWGPQGPGKGHSMILLYIKKLTDIKDRYLTNCSAVCNIVTYLSWTTNCMTILKCRDNYNSQTSSKLPPKIGNGQLKSLFGQHSRLNQLTNFKKFARNYRKIVMLKADYSKPSSSEKQSSSYVCIKGNI